MSRTAFLVLDMQNDIADPKGKIGAHGIAQVVEKRGLVQNIRRVQDKMRAKGQPVVFVRVGFREDYRDALSRSARLAKLKQAKACVLGTWGTEFLESIAPLPDEMIYTKRAVNPFFNTALLAWLRHQGVDTLALSGIYTHMVVDSTARYADDAGFVVKVLEDCCASPDAELHRIEVEKILPLFSEVMTSREFIDSL
jgi:nicotinamidase-related amidase